MYRRYPKLDPDAESPRHGARETSRRVPVNQTTDSVAPRSKLSLLHPVTYRLGHDSARPSFGAQSQKRWPDCFWQQVGRHSTSAAGLQQHGLSLMHAESQSRTAPRGVPDRQQSPTRCSKKPRALTRLHGMAPTSGNTVSPDSGQSVEMNSMSFRHLSIGDPIQLKAGQNAPWDHPHSSHPLYAVQAGEN